MPNSPHAASVLEHLTTGVVVLDAEGRVASRNPAARRLLGPLPDSGTSRCCDLVGCRRPGTPLEGGCIAERVRTRGAPVGELRIHAPGGDVWLTATPLGETGEVVLQVRPDHEPEGGADERLRIRALGSMRLEVGGAVLEGDWLAHRPGQVLKYLVATRGHPVTSEELLSTFWPHPDHVPAATNVRQAVHALRDRLEPDRERQAPSRYIAGRRGGGYELVSGCVLIDADAFVAAAESGLHAVRSRDAARAEVALARAAQLYRGDFLADEQEAEWALTERARLRAIAGRVLRALAGVRLRAGELEAASDQLHRLAELEPLDVETQRQLLTVLMRCGRRTEAARRYEVVRRRFHRAFGEEPGFALTDLSRRRA